MQGKDLWDTTFSFVDLLCSFSNTPFSFPAVADRIQRDYFVTATALSEAYRIDWYDVDMHGTPRFTSRSFLEYLRAAVRHYKSSPYDLKGDDLVGSLSVDYFNASMLYVKRAFQFANEYMSRQPHASSRDEGVIIDLINIALSLRDYYPSCNLRSLPIMQALFMALLPDVPLTMEPCNAPCVRPLPTVKPSSPILPVRVFYCEIRLGPLAARGASRAQHSTSHC